MPNPIRGYFTVFASRALRTGYPQELFDEARALLAKASPEDLRGSGLLGLCAKDGTEHRGAPGFTGDPWGRAPAPMAADGSLMLCEDATAPNLRVLARKSPEAGAALMALPAAIDKIFGFGPDHFDESSHQRPWSSAELWMERWLPGFGAMLAQGLPAILERLLATGKASSFAMACVKTANLPLLNRCAQAGVDLGDVGPETRQALFLDACAAMGAREEAVREIFRGAPSSAAQLAQLAEAARDDGLALEKA